MAVIRSLGLYEPSAIRYLVAESILPPNPTPSLYRWDVRQISTTDNDFTIEEEVLTCGHHVVWSQGGIVKRVFSFQGENEEVLHAFTTGLDTPRLPKHAGTHKKSVLNTGLQRSLVVVLRTQVHVFLLSGDSHVLPLHFEVESAFPAPFGFLLQRKESQDHAIDLHQSLVVHQNSHGHADRIHRKNVSLGHSNRPRLVLPELPDIVPRNGVSSSSKLPKVLSYTETMADMGLVVQGKQTEASNSVEMLPLSAGEDILYLSSENELQSETKNQEVLCVCLTANHSTSVYTVWQVVKLVSEEGTSSSTKTKVKATSGQRKSSNIFSRSRGSATPNPRGPANFRESFGGRGILQADHPHFLSSLEERSFPEEGITAQLERDLDVGVQTRAARRVSSMLVRTDLAGGSDRNTFNDFAVGSRKSLGRSMRRGESTGSFNERQSYGFRRRSSFQIAAASSILSTGTSFLDIPARSLEAEFDPLSQLDGLDDGRTTSTYSDLSRNIAFLKVKTIKQKNLNIMTNSKDDLKVSTFVSPLTSRSNNEIVKEMFLILSVKKEKRVSIIKLSVRYGERASRSKGSNSMYTIKATDIRSAESISDVCLVSDGHIKRLLLLTQLQQGGNMLQLDAPWAPSFSITLPSTYAHFDPFKIQRLQENAIQRMSQEGVHRTMPSKDVDIINVQTYDDRGQLLLTDRNGNLHTLQCGLRPQDSFVSQLLDMTDLIFSDDLQDSLTTGWWEVVRWLKPLEMFENVEWAAFVILIFIQALPYLEGSTITPMSPQKRKKHSNLRSSSGMPVDMSSWEEIFGKRGDPKPLVWTQEPCWQWFRSSLEGEEADIPVSPVTNHHRSSSRFDADVRKSAFLSQCILSAKEFIQTPVGEQALGPEGFLPTAVNKNMEVRRTALPKILLGMHLLYEEHKLNDFVMSPRSNFPEAITIVMAQLGSWLKWPDWTFLPGKYLRMESLRYGDLALDAGQIHSLDVPKQPFDPPSIFEAVEKFVQSGQSSTFPTMLDIVDGTNGPYRNHPSWLSASKITPKSFFLLEFMADISLKSGPRSMLAICQKPTFSGFTHQHFPEGIVAGYWQASAGGRVDKQKSVSKRSKEDRHLLQGNSARFVMNHNHDAVRDFHNISTSTLESETLQKWDASTEADRHAITRLIFSEDRRFQEASKLVNQTRAPIVEYTPEPDWSESDLLEAQKDLAQYVTRRTFSVASGRGMLHFNARVPLLTERVPIPQFSLSCLMKPKHESESTPAMTFSADKALFTEEKVCWAFFHNGTSSGLMISRDARWIDTSWILYNKPAELTNRHAGFLLALGLNGHLKSLAKWVAFKYLTPKHTMTSIGLLLGLSASYLGTMDSLIARLLSVHVTRLLPPGAAELNISPLTQTTGLLGIGLLYYGSRHRRMSEVMLSEIENSTSEESSGDEPILRDEGYRLAAGFALGLINLGYGNQLQGLQDMSLLERLLKIAIGTKNIDLVHVLDRATAGAVVAVALIYMKTNDRAVARKIDIPDTVHQFDYVRADIFLLRTLARHLILWDAVEPAIAFVQRSLPQIYRHRADLANTKYLSTEDLPFYNILTGICFAIGLRFAGSQRFDVRDILVAYLDQFLRLVKLPAPNYDARVTMNNVRNCLDVVALASATVMAGSGDLVVLRRLRALHGRTDKETPFGSHLAAHMAIGALFLGGGTTTFGSSNLAVACLLIAFYPMFPADALDNRNHLQAFRHLWVLAVEGRCLVARDAETGVVIGGLEARVHLNSGKQVNVRAPGLLPEFHLISSIDVSGEGYWDLRIDMKNRAVKLI